MVAVATKEVVVRVVVAGGEVVIGMEGAGEVVAEVVPVAGVVLIIPPPVRGVVPPPICVVVLVVDRVVMPDPAEPLPMVPPPADMVVPDVPGALDHGDEVIMVLVPVLPEVPRLMVPVCTRRACVTTSRPLVVPGVCAAALEPGPALVDAADAVPVFAVPRATTGRSAAFARVPKPDSTAQAAPTATSTRPAATIVSIMCLDQFTFITS